VVFLEPCNEYYSALKNVWKRIKNLTFAQALILLFDKYGDWSDEAVPFIGYVLGYPQLSTYARIIHD